MILLEPLGGLANRLRVIASGIWLKKKLETKLVVIWNENYELRCPYNLLFEDCGIFYIKKKERKYNYIETSSQANAIKKYTFSTINKFIGVDFCIQEQDFYRLIWKNKLDIFETAKKHKVTYIQTCQEFGDNSFAFQYFQPILSITKKINLITKNFTEFTIGIHIRRTDHTHSIQCSPIHLFIDKMKAELIFQKETTFFLCTDDIEVEKSLNLIFAEKIINSKKELSRETIQGMQDAVVDLYCLSKTKKILGSYSSSYSDIASRLNDIDLEVIKTNDLR